MEQEHYYREVPFTEPDPQSPVYGMDRYDADCLTGEMELRITLMQPLHVGSGALVPPEKYGFKPNYPLIKEFQRTGTALTIPGTSIKGVVRSLVEAFTASCAPVPPSRQACKYDARHDRGELCPACGIFGALGFQGRIRFSPASLKKGKRSITKIPPQYSHKQNARARRYYPHNLIDPAERNWPLEVVQPEGVFGTLASFTNLEPGELGLVLIALGQGQWDIHPKLGAGKSAGLGAVKIEVLRIESIQPEEMYTSFDAGSHPVDIQECIQEAQPWILQRNLEKIANDLNGKRLQERSQ